MNSIYGEDQIKVLSDIDHIRLRKHLYIGDASHPFHLFLEVMDNSVDEVQSGCGTHIDIYVNTSENSYRIVDDGRGIPHGTKIINNEPVEILRLLCTKLNSGAKFDNESFTVDVMNETVRKTTLYKLTQNSYVNLERAMLVNSRFGGHIVSGHIDGTGTISDIKKDGIAFIYKINTTKEITKYIINKGSITIDGISLTVVSVSDTSFTVSIIPHTMTVTNLGKKKIGDMVNLENDCIAKYVEKMLDNKQEKKSLLEKLKEI